MKSKNCPLWYRVFVWLRPIIAHRYVGLFGVWFFIWYALFRKREVYRKKYNQYKEIKCIDMLIDWFDDNYTYNNDPLFGAIDHDNSEYEFFSSNGDCEDVAFYARGKLREFGYKAERIYMVDLSKGMSSSHVDCIYRNEDGYFLFDYASPIYGVSIQECVDKLCERWYSRSSSDRVVWCTKRKI